MIDLPLMPLSRRLRVAGGGSASSKRIEIIGSLRMMFSSTIDDTRGEGSSLEPDESSVS